ncbi:YhzD family protein [Domibacillus indicus]|uniref:YhzD family protein n=1 Tax=Domibacillus indicus TaxID=1437523 RepID=UPI000617E894|nr:YhzD family protein [Domibacillus indicus]
MKTYRLTIFEKDGAKKLDHSFEAGSDEEAKTYGLQLLQKQASEEKIYRCTSSEGKLLLFHS